MAGMALTAALLRPATSSSKVALPSADIERIREEVEFSPLDFSQAWSSRRSGRRFGFRGILLPPAPYRTMTRSSRIHSPWGTLSIGIFVIFVGRQFGGVAQIGDRRDDVIRRDLVGLVRDNG